VIITFHYKDCSKTISLSQIENTVFNSDINAHALPEKNGNRDTITVLFSYIRLRRVILAAPVIFASQVILPYGQFWRRI